MPKAGKGAERIPVSGEGPNFDHNIATFIKTKTLTKIAMLPGSIFLEEAGEIFSAV